MQPLVAIYRDRELMCYVRTQQQWDRFFNAAGIETHPYWAMGVANYNWVMLAGSA